MLDVPFSALFRASPFPRLSPFPRFWMSPFPRFVFSPTQFVHQRRLLLGPVCGRPVGGSGGVVRLLLRIGIGRGCGYNALKRTSPVRPLSHENRFAQNSSTQQAMGKVSLQETQSEDPNLSMGAACPPMDLTPAVHPRCRDGAGISVDSVAGQWHVAAAAARGARCYHDRASPMARGCVPDQTGSSVLACPAVDCLQRPRGGGRYFRIWLVCQHGRALTAVLRIGTGRGCGYNALKGTRPLRPPDPFGRSSAAYAT